MNLLLDRSLALGYKSKSQIARKVTEGWIASNMFCPICGDPGIEHLPENSPVGDFICSTCGSEYELKSKVGDMDSIGRTIPDGAYGTMIARITSNRNPHLFVMSHADWRVNGLVMVPKFLFAPGIIRKRPPLGPRARKAGWVGCNIAIGEIPESGKINIVVNGCPCDQKEVLNQYRGALSLQTNRINQRGWLLDVLHCVERIPSFVFTIEDAYAFETALKSRYPGNQFVRPKIRQQLQRLRDRGYLTFLGNGVYKKTEQLRSNTDLSDQTAQP